MRRGRRKGERKKRKKELGGGGIVKKVRMHFGPLTQYLVFTISTVMKKCKWPPMLKPNFCHSRIF